MAKRFTSVAALLAGLGLAAGIAMPVAASTGDAGFARQQSQSDGSVDYRSAAEIQADAAKGRPGEVRYALPPETKAFFERLSRSDGNP